MTQPSAVPDHTAGSPPLSGGPGATTGSVIDLRQRPKTLGERPAASLSPSRAGDFLTCPLLYRLRSIDRIAEPPGPQAARGTLVHSVLDRLFDRPAAARTPDTAVGLLPEAWASITEQEPHLAGLLFGPDDAWDTWVRTQQVSEFDRATQDRFLAEAADYVRRYFEVEDPTRLEPAERELPVSVALQSGLVMRGIVDRLDRAPNGALRVVDYKTGRSPGEGWEAKALFQMRFYGVILWRMYGQVPARLQLLYLGNQERITLDPTEAELGATQAKVQALWEAIERATHTGNWQPRPSKLCNWCSFQSLCPEFGGTPPDLPEPVSLREGDHAETLSEPR